MLKSLRWSLGTAVVVVVLGASIATLVINAIRAHLAEFGIVAPVGRNGVEELLRIVGDAGDKQLPELARACVATLGAQLRTLKAQILHFDRVITAWHRSNMMSKRLDELPDVATGFAGPRSMSRLDIAMSLS